MWKRFLIAAGIVVALSAGVTATAALLQVDTLVQAFGQRPHLHLGSGLLAETQAGKPQTILVLGSDRRYIQGVDEKRSQASSDTIILIRLNADALATTIMSIPRDTHVAIPTKHGIVHTKINAAYRFGGDALATRTIERLLGIQINHVIDVGFRGFEHAVDYLGCVYTDVDKRYFNDNSQAIPGVSNYAVINIKPGYQCLHGTNALAYVRYRHGDSDIVRTARQQDFIRQAKDQLSANRIFNDRNKLAHILGRYTRTDRSVDSLGGLLKLLILGAHVADKPIRRVNFKIHYPANPLQNTDLYYKRSDVTREVSDFLSASPERSPASGALPAAAGAHHRHHHARRAAEPLVDAADSGAAQAADIAGHVRFPVFYPTKLAPKSVYTAGLSSEPAWRAYHIKDQEGARHSAYRLVVQQGAAGLGQYYGVQGTTWQDPPLLQSPHTNRTYHGREYLIYHDGKHIRLVAWKTAHAAYWVSNTLLESISDRQMLGIAHSMGVRR